MNEKIQWYEEILATDPTSKIFFPLAQLYIQTGQSEKASQVLREGLNKHPEHLEARLVFLQVLNKQENETEFQRILFSILSLFQKYHEIWNYWIEVEEEQNNLDLAVALRFIHRHLSQEPSSWADVLRRGLESLNATEQKDQSEEVQDSESQSLLFTQEEDLNTEVTLEDALSVQDQEVQPQEETRDGNVPVAHQAEDVEDRMSLNTDSYKTQTMADILASQGNITEALNIYNELLDKGSSQTEKEHLEIRIQELRDLLEPEPVTSQAASSTMMSDKTEHTQDLVNTLEKLATRLEKKGQE
jgi:tetratricopeptide (TPR) repeat protein